MPKPRLLDLFCCAGGAARGYQKAGFHVIGVDINPQPHYCGDEFYKADAIQFMDILLNPECGLSKTLVSYSMCRVLRLEDISAIHASPPCQKYTKMQHIHKNHVEHPDLIEPIRQKLIQSSKPFVIENVIGAPLRIDLMLCGTMFDLRVPKHRIFESNVPMPLSPATCNHQDVYDPFHGGEQARNERVKFAQVLKIDWFMTRTEVRDLNLTTILDDLCLKMYNTPFMSPEQYQEELRKAAVAIIAKIRAC